MTRALLLALALALAGCAELLTRQGQDAAEVDALVAEALSAARAPGGEQKAALARAQQAFERDRSALNRLRLATLLAVLPAPMRDDARTVELLEPLSDAASPGTGRFAAFLAAQVADRQRIQREVERLARESERAARERSAADRERERLDKERDKREEAMRHQLEALRSIERGILEREERLRRRQR
jgi:hypothetical protein